MDSDLTGYGDPEEFYTNHYERVLRTGVAGGAQDRTHRRMEAPWGAKTAFAKVLEVGAGQGEHFSFVKHGFDSYVEIDVRTPRVATEVRDPRRTFMIEDAEHLSFPDSSFDRVIATCLLLHLEHPEAALTEWRRVTRPGGVISMLVPCDPGILIRTTRQLITVPAVNRSGFAGYKLFNARDHRNHVGSIEQLIRFVFRHDAVRVDRYPFPWPSWNLNAFFVFQVTRSAPRDLG